MVSVIDLVGRVGDTVKDVMTPDPVCASEDTPAEEIAGIMLEQMVRRVPIVRGGRVIGIVSASDIVQPFLNLHEKGAVSEEGGDGRAQKPLHTKRGEGSQGSRKIHSSPDSLSHPRGVSCSVRVVVLDGGKGLRRAVHDVFGEQARVQRCVWHKRENVVDHLPKRLQPAWRAKLQQVYRRPTYETAAHV